MQRSSDKSNEDLRLISKFTVSTTSHQHVRIADASLDLPPDGLDGVTIQPAVKKRRVVVSSLKHSLMPQC